MTVFTSRLLLVTKASIEKKISDFGTTGREIASIDDPFAEQ